MWRLDRWIRCGVDTLPPLYRIRRIESATCAPAIARFVEAFDVAR